MRKFTFFISLFLLFPSIAGAWVSEGTQSYCNSSAKLCNWWWSNVCYVYTFEGGYYKRYDYSMTEANCNNACVDSDPHGFNWNKRRTTDPGDLQHVYLTQACYSHAPDNNDWDNDGASDFCELNNGAAGDMFSAGTVTQCPILDTDSDGISDDIEAQLGTDPNTANDMVSANFTNMHIDNYDPEAHDYVVGFTLENGDVFKLDEFTLDAMPAFGSPDSYTLGNYGEVPDGVDIMLYKMEDDIPIPQIALTPPTTSTGSEVVWDEAELPTTYTGPTGSAGIGPDATEVTDNSETAAEIWDSMTTPVNGMTLPQSTSADTQIDPKDIAQGVDLALNHPTTSTTASITSTEDSDVAGGFSGLSNSLTDFGGTNFDSNLALNKDGITGGLGVLSWVEDLYSIPSIGQVSSVTIGPFEFLSLTVPEITIDFDIAIIPAVRALFLFFFYLSCVWVFFKLTRYAWG